MLLYHGSTVHVKHPQIFNTNPFLDFGAGFYTTSSYEQAERWAKVKMRRENKTTGYVTVYDFDLKQAKQNGQIVVFQEANESWLRFVIDNRRGIAPAVMADLYVGPVADDNVYAAIKLFEAGIYHVEETLKRLKTEVLKDQWTFRTEHMLSYLTYLEEKEIFSEVRL